MSNNKYKVEIIVNGKFENAANLNLNRISILNDFLNDLDKAQKIEEKEGKTFEGVYIFSPYISKAEIESTINEIKKQALKVTNIEQLGIKRLAYKIPNRNTNTNKEHPVFEFGQYVILEYELSGEQLIEIEKLARLNANIMKFMNIEKN